MNHVEQWFSILQRERLAIADFADKVHLAERLHAFVKEWTKKGTDYSLESFRPLLDGTTNWPAVMEAFDQTGYKGYLTFEYFHPYLHFPEALVYQTADSLNRMLGIKG